MTVGQLIKKLSKCPKGHEVMINGDYAAQAVESVQTYDRTIQLCSTLWDPKRDVENERGELLAEAEDAIDYYDEEDEDDEND